MVTKILVSMKNAFKGIKTFLQIQKKYWFLLFFFVAFVIFALPLGFSPVEEAIIILNLGLIWVFEMINTSIELTIDLVTTEYNDLAKKAKDIASGAVLTSQIILVINFTLVLLNHI